MSRLEIAEHVLGQARFTQALTVTAIGAAVLAPLIVRLSGWAGLAGVLGTLAVLALGALWSLRLELEIRHLPLTMLAFVAWAALSVVWSRYAVEAFCGVIVFIAFGLLGAFIALTRDLSQIVRATGRVLRAVLGVSLAIEFTAGLLIDSPIRALGVHGNLGRLGPLQGLLGTPDLLALTCVLAAVTFVVEHRMGALPRWWALTAVAGAVLLLSMTRSAVGVVLGGIAAFAFFGLAFIDRAPASHRSSRQVAVVIAAGIAVLVGWALRWPLAGALNGVSEALYRLEVWRQVMALYPFQWLLGRGFLGRWRGDVAPYSEIDVPSRSVPDAASAYIDALMQLGIVGFALLVLALVAALTRSWLLASRKRAVVYIWPAVVLTVLAASGVVLSNLLFELGWLLFVICAVKASHQISWRSALGAQNPASGDGVLG